MMPNRDRAGRAGFTRGGWAWWRAIGRGAIIALVAVGALTACGGDAEVSVEEPGDDAPADYAFVIPPGAGEALDRGEPLEILPPELEVHVGQVLEIVNLDDRGHLVGPFFVGANETMRQRFASPGQYQGICTVHPSGEITLTVT
jgi:hypothetical protein